MTTTLTIDEARALVERGRAEDDRLKLAREKIAIEERWTANIRQAEADERQTSLALAEIRSTLAALETCSSALANVSEPALFRAAGAESGELRSRATKALGRAREALVRLGGEHERAASKLETLRRQNEERLATQK